MRTARMTAEAVVSDELTTTTPILLATIRAAQHGDSRAFEELMILSERRVANVAWRILGDAEEVKEAMQETFLRVFRHLKRYDETRDFFGWLYRIAVNTAISMKRKQRVVLSIDATRDGEPAVDPADPDVVYAGLRAGGVRRSVDGGQS